MVTGSSHVISCVLTDLKSQLTTVQWSTTSNTNNVYSATEGVFSGKSQTSTLSLSSNQIAALRSLGASHTLTCATTVGDTKSTVTATQTVNISYRGGTYYLLCLFILFLFCYFAERVHGCDL